MVCAFVHKIPSAKIEGGLVVLEFPSGDGVVSVALTRHAALGLLNTLPRSIEVFDQECEPTHIDKG